MRRILVLMCLLAVAGCAMAPAPGAGAGADRAGHRVDEPASARSRSMSFAELFELAKGRSWTDEEVRGFQALDQPGKNRVVRELAAEAGGIRTEDQVGTDGVVYTAFWRE